MAHARPSIGAAPSELSDYFRPYTRPLFQGVASGARLGILHLARLGILHLARLGILHLVGQRQLPETGVGYMDENSRLVA